MKDGRSFRRLLRDPAAVSLRRFSFAEQFDPNGNWPSGLVAERAFAAPVLGGGVLYKLIRRPGLPDEVYDLSNDPLELVDLGTAHPAYAPLASSSSTPARAPSGIARQVYS